jgi:type IX secretion system PorP/SprF family membrane protein
MSNIAKIIYINLLLFFLSGSIFGQDIHFSQYMTAPQIINPSLAGFYNADYRITANYRQQWTAIGFPVKTSGISADFPFFFNQHKLATGLIYIHDYSSSIALQQNMVYTSLAYHYTLQHHYFRIGVQPGLVLQSYNPEKLLLPEQYNMYTGTYDTSIPITSNDFINNNSYFDLNAGASWSTNYKNMTFTTGLSAFHFLQPTNGFNADKKQNVRWLLHSKVQVPITPFISVSPSLVMVKQAKASEILAGAELKHAVNYQLKALKSFSAGVFFRTSLFQNFDALILNLGICYAKWEAYCAYDITLSNLGKATQYRGSIELAFIFKGLLYNENTIKTPCNIQ